eukprot:CAMPEP_0197319568 /NCGR_PEP_ID=MMETSP0891-20130614/55495_1 /TAXON_ID=44058 ORGANISM="Aureoumbra lagunensis, Strain CCMP1510" /NCGR_SAMPLE_ID=MMETSP0891 /ASSEMBLY_ACC=CAM_ASM_000534 /LENGTH=309 /DNA_ID=CAMNT_0042810577 /DNA_START=190 /DNA_END=1119 /DNA_ORIENTATION=+
MEESQLVRHEETGCQILVSTRVVEGDEEKIFPAPGGDRPLSYYPLDGASILPALALLPCRGDRVLDACAAPGGKTLLLADQLYRVGGGTLTANEKASSRRQRLRRLVDDYLPLGKNNISLNLQGLDAIDKRKWQSTFDKILIDAPCSSERHFIRGANGAEWSVSRLKRDAKLQLAILRCMLNNLKIGGTIVYSTCSLDPQQNDDIISAVLDDAKFKHPHTLKVDHPLKNLHFNHPIIISGIELTRHGAIALPDRASGFGPLYWAVLTSLGYRSTNDDNHQGDNSSCSSSLDNGRTEEKTIHIAKEQEKT